MKTPDAENHKNQCLEEELDVNWNARMKERVTKQKDTERLVVPCKPG